MQKSLAYFFYNNIKEYTWSYKHKWKIDKDYIWFMISTNLPAPPTTTWCPSVVPDFHAPPCFLHKNNNKEEEEQQGCPLQLLQQLSQTHLEVPYPCLHDPRSCTHVLLFYFSHRPLECRILVHSRRSPFLWFCRACWCECIAMYQ